MTRETFNKLSPAARNLITELYEFADGQDRYDHHPNDELKLHNATMCAIICVKIFLNNYDYTINLLIELQSTIK